MQSVSCDSFHMQKKKDLTWTLALENMCNTQKSEPNTK